MYYLGQQGKFSEVKDVEISEVFTYDDTSMTYGELKPTADLASKFTENGEDCSCAQALKEVYYTVNIEAKDSPRGSTYGKKYYAISSIKAEVTISKNPITATCGTKIGVNQKFQINF